MTLRLMAFAATASILATGAGAAGVAAPEPMKPIDPARFYVGRWYEIARTPQKITDGCVAGTTDYVRDARGRLFDRDACRDQNPEGKEKVYAGPVTILDAANTKVIVHYKVWGLFTVNRTYWMLDHDDDYSWFLVSDPKFDNVNIFTRAPNPPKAEVERLSGRLKSMGYDISRLEFPTQFPPGEGRPER